MSVPLGCMIWWHFEWFQKTYLAFIALCGPESHPIWYNHWCSSISTSSNMGASMIWTAPYTSEAPASSSLSLIQCVFGLDLCNISIVAVCPNSQRLEACSLPPKESICINHKINPLMKFMQVSVAKGIYKYKQLRYHEAALSGSIQIRGVYYLFDSLKDNSEKLKRV